MSFLDFGPSLGIYWPGCSDMWGYYTWFLNNRLDLWKFDASEKSSPQDELECFHFQNLIIKLPDVIN